jgi:hypothetical protein
MKLTLENKCFALLEAVSFLQNYESSADEKGDYEARIALANQLEARRIKMILSKGSSRLNRISVTPRPLP